MDNFIKLSIIFIIFLEIQIAFCRPNISPLESNNVIQKLCKINHYQKLCISTLNLDPRSHHSNLQGLAWISLDVTSKKVNESFQYLTSELKKTVERGDFEMYGTCVELYGAAVNRFLPAAFTYFKAKKYSQVMSLLKEVVSAPVTCEEQFAGNSPLTGLNKAVHDIAYMTADVIKTFIN